MSIQSGDGSTRRRALRVLIIGDEQESTDALVELVHRLGHAARVAQDGFAEPRVKSTQKADVVLLDMESPRIDACRIAKQLRTRLPRQECFIMAVMEQADAERRQECIAAGIDVLLRKPLDCEIVETLLALESVHVNRRRQINSVTSFHG